MIMPIGPAGKPLGVGALTECCISGNEKPNCKRDSGRASLRLAGDQSRSQMITAAIGRPTPTAPPSIITKSRSRLVPTRADITLTPSGPAPGASAWSSVLS
jgi:hypothetical protein